MEERQQYTERASLWTAQLAGVRTGFVSCTSRVAGAWCSHPSRHGALTSPERDDNPTSGLAKLRSVHANLQKPHDTSLLDRTNKVLCSSPSASPQLRGRSRLQRRERHSRRPLVLDLASGKSVSARVRCMRACACARVCDSVAGCHASARGLWNVCMLGRRRCCVFSATRNLTGHVCVRRGGGGMAAGRWRCATASCGR